MKLALTIISLFLITSCSTTNLSAQSNNSSKTQTIPSISYCALLKNPKLYSGKTVRIKAVWQFGFETTSLQDRQCIDQPKAWLEFADEKQLCPETKKNRTLPKQSDKEADVTVTGRLYGSGRYGHLGDYQFKFVVECMENIKVTSSDLK